MALLTQRLIEEATCPECLQLMSDPVVTDCGHSFCHVCIVGIIEKQQREKPTDGMYFCARCKISLQRESLRPNKHLQNIIKIIKAMSYEKLCEVHGEKLHLFCENDDKLICFFCQREPPHNEHVTVLAEVACQEYKERLQNAATKLRDDQSQCNILKSNLKKQKRKWMEKVKFQRQKISAEFEALRSFLDKEQEHYLKRLKENEERTLRQLQEEEDMLERQSQDLRHQILELERRCQDSAQNVLQGVKLTLSRSFDVKLETPEVITLNLPPVCNVSELYFNVRKVLEIYRVSVTLDPDTAHTDLLLSDHRKKVTGGHPQEKPSSSSRFTALPCVLGCEGFSSGRHYFEVSVEEEGQFCAVGVCLASVKRDISVRLLPENGFWTIVLSMDNGVQAHCSTQPPPIQERFSLVGVFVDYEAGLVSFYNMKTDSHIFTFPKASFPDSLLPFFYVDPSSSLRIICLEMQ